MTIPFDDRGFTLGDGLFETVLAEDGALAFWREHVERLKRGCTTLGLPLPDEGLLREQALAALEEAGLGAGRAAVRLSWTAGRGGRGLDRPETFAPLLVVQAAPAPAPTHPARLVTASVRRNAASPVSRLKTLAYLDQVLARREALAAGGDEARDSENKARPCSIRTQRRASCPSGTGAFENERGLHGQSLCNTRAKAARAESRP